MLLREFINNIQLQELFNFSYPYHLIVDNYYLSFDYWEKKYEANTKIGKLHVLFMIKKTIVIEFSIEGAYDITGLANGEQFRILSTVWNIVSNELPKLIDDSIHTIKFTAEHDEPSRVSLYRRVAPKITALLGAEWKRSEDEDEDTVIFLWRRQQSNNQTLTELFNFSYPYTMISDKKNILGGKIKQYAADTPIGELNINFFINPIDTISISFTVNGDIDITGLGQGEQFRIFGTVIEIVKNHLPDLIDDRTKKITFSADGDEISRVSLYRKLAPKLTQILGNDWEFKEKLHKTDYDYYDFIWTRKETDNEILLELGNFSYPVDSKIEKISDEEIHYHYFSNTPLGLLKTTIIEQSYTDDYGELVKYLSLHFTVNDTDKRTNQALELDNGEEFRILSTVWQVISKELPKLIDQDTMIIYFDANTKEPSRDPTRLRKESSRIALYKSTANRISKLLGPDWEFGSDTLHGKMNFQWRNIADIDDELDHENSEDWNDQEEYPEDWYKQDY